jgi:hypothetical protein
MTNSRPTPAIALDTLVARGLVHDIPKQPAPPVFAVALGFLASTAGRAVTTRDFRPGALANAGRRMLAAGGEPPAVRNALRLVQTSWVYAWRLGLADGPPDELPTIAAARPEPIMPTPEEMAERKATVHAARGEKERRKKGAAKGKPRGKKAKPSTPKGKASSHRPSKRAK